MLIVVQLLLRDHAGLFPGVELADLFQRQQFVDLAGRVVHGVFLRQGMSLHHAAGDDDGAHVLQSADAHQHGGDGFIAAGDEHAAVVDAGVGLRLDQIDHGFPVGQGIIDAVMALSDAITHICGKITGGFSTVLVDRAGGFPDKLIQMGAAGMAVAEGAFDQNLGLGQIVRRPAHADFQRIVFRREGADFLRTQFHGCRLRGGFGCAGRRRVTLL